MGDRLAAILPIALITVLGAALRLSQIEQSLSGDELWSWLGATSPSFGGMLDWVRSDQEVTPPLYTVLAWGSVQVGEPESWIRLPSVLAGIATIPLVYAIATRTLGQGVARLAALLVALSPFLTFYSIEARAYSLAVALIAAATLSLLVALGRGRAWLPWAAYAAFSCAAMLTHYTSAYVLGAQLLFVLVTRPEARLPALLANAGAAAFFALWLPGVIEDFTSPSQENIGLLAPFTFQSFHRFTGAWALGHPLNGLESFYGVVEVALLAGIAVAVAGLALRLRPRAQSERRSATWDSVLSRREAVAFFVCLALAAPVCIALVSLVSTDMYIPRNLATSLPALLIVLAALIALTSAGFRAVATLLVVGAFAWGAIETFQPEWKRSPVRDAAELVDASAAEEDVVLDAVWFGGGSPEGTSPPVIAETLDAHLDSRDPIDALSQADIEAARDGATDARLWIVGYPDLVDGVRARLGLEEEPAAAARTFEGTLPIEVLALDIPG